MAESLVHILRAISGEMVAIVVSIRKKLESLRKMDSTQIVMHSVASGLEKLLKVSATFAQSSIVTCHRTLSKSNLCYY